MFFGDMGTSLWKRGRWEETFDQNMIIVCTAEILRHCLHHSFISMDKINLLIFDEAHHAKKDHPYARIIKDFYVQATHEGPCPRIFGMTASPVDARVDPKKAAAELEALLHCQIATASDSRLLKHVAASMHESVATYAPLRPKVETPLYSQMYARFKKNEVIRKPLLFAFEATRELGSWCSDQMWPLCTEEDELKKLRAKTERKYLERTNAPLEVLHRQQADVDEAQAIVKAHIFDPPDFEPQDTFVESKNLSSKVLLLIQYLRERFQRPTDDKCIVFVKQRYTARLLKILLSESKIRTRHLFVGTLVST